MPDLIQYLALGVGFVAMWSFGRIFVERDVGLSLLVGCLIVGGAISTVAWTFPFLARPIAAVAASIGLARLLYDWRRGAIAFDFGWHAAMTIMVVGLALRSLEVHFYRVVSDDTTYWQPALELLKADYRGGLRHFLYFPYEMATIHLLPSTVTVALSFLVPAPTFGIILEAKYLLMVIVFGTALSRLGRIAGASPMIFFVALLSAYVVFRSEIGMSLIMSNYVYATTLVAIFSVMLTPAMENPDESRQTLLLLAILLVTTKGPIFYIAAALSFYLWWRYSAFRFSPRTIVVGIMSLLVVWSWTHVPTPYQGEEDQSFWVANPLKPRQILMIADVVGWSVSDNFRDLALRFLAGSKSQGETRTTSELISAYLPAVALLPYILVKYYGTVAGFVFVFYRRNELTRPVAVALTIYLVISILGWLLLRNGGSFRHQAHAYLLCSFLAFATLFFWSMRSRVVLGFAVLLAIFFGFGRNISDPFVELMDKSPRSQNVAAFSASAKKPPTDTGFHVPDKSDPSWAWAVNFEAMATGRRIAWQDNATLRNYQVRPWVLCKTPVYDVEPSGYQRLKECHDHPPYKY